MGSIKMLVRDSTCVASFVKMGSVIQKFVGDRLTHIMVISKHKRR